ncbi:MAG: hypothetical protein Q9213_002382 [Squamulea squamosa]
MASPSPTPKQSSVIASDIHSSSYASVSPPPSAPSEHHRNMSSSRPVHGTRPSSSSVSSVQKSKKRVPWRGKTCIISIPTSHSRNGYKRYENHNPRLALLDAEVRSRSSFPDPQEIIAERARRSFQTRLPDKTQWDIYVKDLQEAKLRALGVSSGREEYREKTFWAASPPTRRPSSHTSSLPVSPFIAPPSTVGYLSRKPYGVPFNPQDTTSLDLRASSASAIDSKPAPQPNVKHISTYSISKFRQSPDIPLRKCSVPSNFASTPPGSSKIPNFDEGILPLYRGTSAAGAVLSHPLGNGLLPPYMGDRVPDSSQQQTMWRSSSQQDRQGHSSSPYPSSPSLPIDLRQSHDQWSLDRRNSEPAFQYPIPRNHRSGIPEALERHIHVAQKNSNKAHDPLLNGDRSGPMGDIIRGSGPVPIENSKVTGNYRDLKGREDSLMPGKPRNQSRPLASSLNVLAPEFRIESNSQPPKSSTASTIMRPTAPAFTPALMSQQIPTSHEFTFLSTGPVFTPVSHVQKPAKSSKAIEIRTPKDEWSTSTPDGEVQEDESGRITQAEGRQKRQRRTSVNGLQNARSLLQAHAPAAAVEQRSELHDLSPTKLSDHQHGRRHSESLKKATRAATQLKEIIDDLATSEDSSSLAQTTESADPEEKAFTFQSITEAVAFDTARPSSASGGMQASPNSFPDHAGPTDQMPTASGLSESVVDGISYIDPSYEGIDAVIKHLNDEGPTPRASDNDVPLNCHIPNQISAHDFEPPKTGLHRDKKSDIQNPSIDDSPSQALQYLPPTESESVNSSIVRLVAQNARFSPSYRPSYASDGPFPAHDLGSAESAAISEWDKALSSSEETRSGSEPAALEDRVIVVVSKALEDRLIPVEESLAAIQESLLALSNQSLNRINRPRIPGNADISDADDEDDVDIKHPTTKSPIRDRKTDKLREMMTEVLASQTESIPAGGLETVAQSIQELKALFQEVGPPSGDVKAVVEEAIARQMRGRSAPITTSYQSATVEKSQLQIAGLESMLKIAEGRAEDEMKARRATEDALADNQRLLRQALQDAAEQRESAEETEQSLSAFHEERHEMLRRNALLEGAQENFQKTTSELAEKNSALEGTLDEYRLSSVQWRQEIESANIENKDLQRTVNALRTEMEEGIHGRQILRAKFDQLQDEMAVASQNIARDQSMWRIKEEEYRARCEILIADGERQSQESEGMAAEITRLTERLRLSEHEHHQAIAELERQLDDQIKRAHLERDRLQSQMDNESQAMTSQLDKIRNTSEEVIASIRSQLDQAIKAANTDRTIFEQELQKAIASGSAALETHQAFHDQVTKSLRDQNEQTELQYSDRLTIAEEKLSLYQDKVEILEEKLEIAKSAAQAAVQAVQPSRSTSKGPQLGHAYTSGSMSSPPAKTSPQALRESIIVLQEQLQNRESQIEQLQQRLAAVDAEAPAKLKTQETEITWLRELLGVRVDDLEDLIAALSRPVHDRDAIKDAAIRLKANIEMEQQEKERALNGPQSFPSLATISNLTSSPRSLPLAAAAAWGSWRKGRIGPVSNFFGGANGHLTDTPSRSLASRQSTLSGLVTPPHSEVGGEHVLGGGSRGSTRSTPRKRPTDSAPRPNPALPSPTTPSLTRRSNYDMDAESTDAVELHSAVDKLPGREVDDAGDAGDAGVLFGPQIAAFSGHA